MTRKKGVPLTNFAASVKARLLERAHEDGEDFNSLPVRNAADDRKFSRLIARSSDQGRRFVCFTVGLTGLEADSLRGLSLWSTLATRLRLASSLR